MSQSVQENTSVSVSVHAFAFGSHWATSVSPPVHASTEQMQLTPSSQQWPVGDFEQ